MISRRATLGTAQRLVFGPAAFAAVPTPLAIPKIMNGEVRDGVRTYDLSLQKGLSHFFEGLETRTLGINAAYLGPTLRMRAGENVRMNVTNAIGESSALHWHGMHLPARFDGGPHQVIADGQSGSVEFCVKQRASMFWYHSNMGARSGPQVYHGLSGLVYVDDDETSRLDLPHDYGIDDIPLVLQDRAFDSDGSLIYDAFARSRMTGVKGDVLLVNGTVHPHFEARTDKLRLRLLNASNARVYTLGFADGCSFRQIGTDGSLLERPHKMSRITLAPGERAQIVVDLDDGTPALLRTFATPGMGMMDTTVTRIMDDNRTFDVLDIRPCAHPIPSAPLPERLVCLPRPDTSRVVGVRRFVLHMDMEGILTGGGTFTINGKSMNEKRIDETVQLGTTEIWEIENDSMMPQSFHIHGVQFRILTRNAVVAAPGEAGLKDTLCIAPNERVRILLGFADYADTDTPYLYHCHTLEYEDAGMMGQFVVRA